jgi:hypothetical protein
VCVCVCVKKEREREGMPLPISKVVKSLNLLNLMCLVDLNIFLMMYLSLATNKFKVLFCTRMIYYISYVLPHFR